VAGDDDEIGILVHGLADESVSAVMHPKGDIPVSGGLSIRDFTRFRPYPLLTWSSENEVQFQRSKVFRFAREIAAEKLDLSRERLVVFHNRSRFPGKRIQDPVDIFSRPDIVNEVQAPLAFSQKQLSQRERIEIGVHAAASSDSQRKALRQCGGQIFLKDLILGGFDVVLQAVKPDFPGAGIVYGAGGTCVAVPGLAYRSRIDEVAHVFFQLEFVAVAREKSAFDEVVMFRVDEGEVGVPEKAYRRSDMKESFGGVELAEDVVVLIERGSVADGDVIMDHAGARVDTAEKAQAFFEEVVGCPLDCGCRNGIEGFNGFGIADGFVMISPNHAQRLESLHLLDHFVGRSAISHHVPEKKIMIDASSLREFQDGEESFQVAVDIGEYEIAHDQFACSFMERYNSWAR